MTHQIIVPEVVRRAGWHWTHAGLEVDITTSEGKHRVVFPIAHVEMIFGQSMQEAGHTLPSVVGCAGSVGGFFTRLEHAQALDGDAPAVGWPWSKKKKRRGRKKKRGGFFGGLWRGIKKIHKTVAKVSKKIITSKVFRGAIAAAAVAFPILAPVAAGVEIAARVILKVEQGKKAVRALRGRVSRRQRPALRAQAIAGAKAKRGIQTMARLAQRGNRSAMQTMGAFTGALGIMHSAQAATRRTSQRAPANYYRPRRTRRPPQRPRWY